MAPSRGAHGGASDGLLEEVLRRGAPIFQELRRCVEASGEPCEGARGGGASPPSPATRTPNL